MCLGCNAYSLPLTREIKLATPLEKFCCTLSLTNTLCVSLFFSFPLFLPLFPFLVIRSSSSVDEKRKVNVMNNISSHTSIHQLSPELILQVVLFLEPKAVVELGLTCHQFADFLFDKKTGVVFRRLVERDFGITYKLPNEQGETWLAFYKDLYSHHDILSSYCCCHLSRLPEDPSETKRVLYRRFKEQSFPCDLCHQQTADYLNLSTDSNVMGKSGETRRAL